MEFGPYRSFILSLAVATAVPGGFAAAAQPARKSGGKVAHPAAPARAARKPAVSKKPPAAKPARRPLRMLPPVRGVGAGPQRILVRDEALRERIAQLERALEESRAREKQTKARLQEIELLLGGQEGSPAGAKAGLTNLVDLYYRLQAVEQERAQIQASATPDAQALKALDTERQAIIQWVRAALGDPAALQVVKPGPTPEMLAAVQAARLEVAAAEREASRIERVTGQGLVARQELLRARSELARARLNLARAEARVRGDRQGEILAAQAQLDAAQAEFNETEADVIRLWNLQKAGAVAAVEVNAAEARLRKGRAAMEAAQADLRRLQEQKQPVG
jgi:hypothetical protein